MYTFERGRIVTRKVRNKLVPMGAYDVEIMDFKTGELLFPKRIMNFADIEKGSRIELPVEIS